MSIRSTLQLASLALLVTLVGCKGVSRRTIEITGAEATPGEVVAVDVTNFNGRVRIIADDTRDEPQVRATTRAKKGLFRRFATQEQLKAVWIGAELVEQEGGTVLRVLARPDTEVPGSEKVRVHLTVTVPACNGVLVRNSGGRVDLRQVDGAIQVENGFAGTKGGRIDVRTGMVLDAPIALTTTEGNVYLQTGADSTGEVDITSEDGTATVRAYVGTLDDVLVTGRQWRGVLNGGSNPVMLKTGKGAARLLVMSNADENVPTNDYERPLYDGPWFDDLR